MLKIIRRFTKVKKNILARIVIVGCFTLVSENKVETSANRMVPSQKNIMYGQDKEYFHNALTPLPTGEVIGERLPLPNKKVITPYLTSINKM